MGKVKLESIYINLRSTTLHRKCIALVRRSTLLLALNTNSPAIYYVSAPLCEPVIRVYGADNGCA